MNTGFYDFARWFVRMLVSIVWRARATGMENFPAQGPVIVACNHRSYLDPPAMGCFSPRRISYMAKKELFKIPILGTVITWLGAYSVDREGSATGAIKQSLKVLQRGGAIGIFPEGTRNRTGTVTPQTGVALLASLADAPVVPASITGTERALRLARIRVVFGKPLALPEGRKATRDDLAKFTAEIMKSIEALAESNSGNT
jgi:1-acyl-sn-glycerol-3-phosphate acyltransferase